ncbi:unnamed protein product [Rangifer tarandus platyrhynchus]|uniref:Uncharacterized protein n=1 Tax=Rangifer tarandus platyrhynchus TaxID=3082113 RepID=A0ABN8Y5Y5_RANTA|nr:unnamed protein product [Rangifer tarandus platyrhynchus]
MHHCFACCCDRKKNATTDNIKMLLTLRLTLISAMLKCEKEVNLGIDEIQSIESRRLHFAKKLMSLLNISSEPVFSVSNTGLVIIVSVPAWIISFISLTT